MIFGVGTDIVAIARVQAMHECHGERFSQRILAPEELSEYALSQQQPHFLAKRFAAKEAFAKAVGTGMRAPVHFHAIRIAHDSLGRPVLAYAAELDAWLRQQGVGPAHLSLSDEREFAVAFVVLEKA